VIEVFSNAVRTISKIMNFVKNCNLDLSVKWFQLLFGKIKLTVEGVWLCHLGWSHKQYFFKSGNIALGRAVSNGNIIYSYKNYALSVNSSV